MVYVNNYNIIEIVITVKIVDQSIANADYLITFISLGQNIPISLLEIASACAWRSWRLHNWYFKPATVHVYVDGNRDTQLGADSAEVWLN